MKMKLWHISQTVNNGYDTYDSAVVAAPDEETARKIRVDETEGPKWTMYEYDSIRFNWVDNPKLVTARLIGIAVSGTKTGVICASYNAA